MNCVPFLYSWDEQILPHSFFLTFIVELLRRQEGGDMLYFELSPVSLCDTSNSSKEENSRFSETSR